MKAPMQSRRCQEGRSQSVEEVQWKLFSVWGAEVLVSKGVQDIVGRRRRSRAHVAQMVLDHVGR